MNIRKIILTLVFVDFAAFSAWAVYQVGIVGFWEGFVHNAGSLQLGIDLVIALGLVMAWMVADARRRGAAWAPWVLLTLVLGSLGPLLYLLQRPDDAPARG